MVEDFGVSIFINWEILRKIEKKYNINSLIKYL